LQKSVTLEYHRH